jgi:regulator of PEP synthase PpsR (kinase-PPPase family)
VKDVSEDIGIAPSGKSGMSHGLKNPHSYDHRMDIVNYTLLHDDAMTLKNLGDADVILVGVSRSGKTPTCLYLALHFGIRAANYPLTDDDFLKDDLPDILKKNQDKLVGLTISPKRIADIREKRRAGSRYADILKCKSELNQAQELFIRYDIPVFNTTSSSIEELSARIFQVVTLRMMPQTKKTYD